MTVLKWEVALAREVNYLMAPELSEIYRGAAYEKNILRRRAAMQFSGVCGIRFRANTAKADCGLFCVVETARTGRGWLTSASFMTLVRKPEEWNSTRLCSCSEARNGILARPSLCM